MIYNLIYERVYLLGKRVKTKYPTMLNLGYFFTNNFFIKISVKNKTPLKNTFFLLKKLILINKISKNALINVFFFSLNLSLAIK
jgi:hypothetical protein